MASMMEYLFENPKKYGPFSELLAQVIDSINPEYMFEKLAKRCEQFEEIAKFAAKEKSSKKEDKKDDKKEEKGGKGLTAAQKKLPEGLRKAIEAKNKKK